MKKLAPSYYRKIDRILCPVARYRELHSWRKPFKAEWKRCSRAETTLPSNRDRYRPDPTRWVCTCPHFAKSRFLICKHLVQSVRPVHPCFFHQVRRERTLPFWKHPSLVPLDLAGSSRPDMQPEITADDSGEDMDGLNDEDDGDSDTDDDDYATSGQFLMDQQTYKEEMQSLSSLFKDFSAGLDYQIQFNDRRLLAALHREAAGAIRFIGTCIEKERRSNNNRVETPRMFDRTLLSAMFWRLRPTAIEG